MVERHRVETTYRGRTYFGEWWLDEERLVRLESAYGSRSQPLYSGWALGAPPTLPSQIAQQMLWDLLRERDRNRPFFYRR
jgi:hypothetical protein